MAQTHASIYMPKVRELREHPSKLVTVYKLYLTTIGLNKDCPWNDYSSHAVLPYGVPTCEVCLQDRPRTFAEIVNGAVIGGEAVIDEDNPVVICAVCRTLEWSQDTHSDVDGNTVCDSCRTNYTACHRCDDWSIAGRRFLTFVTSWYYCESCRDSVGSYCDDCEVWYHEDYAEDHDHDRHVECECTPHDLRFTIPANSHGVMKQDERLLIELPEGHITDQAVNAAIQLLWNEQFSALYQQWMNVAWKPGVGYDYDHPKPDGYVEYNDLDRVIRSLEQVWQAKRGNYTRRLSAALYKELGVKLQEGLLSRVGAVIRSHTTMKNSWHIEFTRDLNQSARAFYHEGSCWWGSESESLCALKAWGGMAMRSYEGHDQERNFPSGRVWIQPLNDDMEPTLDALGARAYVIYNGYGELDGYTPARILAYLTSKTYRKIDFEASHQYVNGSSGYLVADQETCDSTSDVSIDRSYHEAVSA